MNLVGYAGVILLLYFPHTVCREKVEKCGLMDSDPSPVDMVPLQQKVFYVYTSFPVPPCNNITLKYINFCYKFISFKTTKTVRVGKLYIMDNNIVQTKLVLQGDTASCKGNIFTKASHTLCCVSQPLEYSEFRILQGKINKYFALLVPQRQSSISIGYRDNQYKALGYKIPYKGDDQEPIDVSEDSSFDEDNDSSSDEDNGSDNTDENLVIQNLKYYSLSLPLVSFTEEAKADYQHQVNPTLSITETSELTLTPNSKAGQNNNTRNRSQDELNSTSTQGDAVNDTGDNAFSDDHQNKCSNAAIYSSVGYTALIILSSILFAVSVILGIIVVLQCWSKRGKGNIRSSARVSRPCFGHEMGSASSWTYFNRNSEAKKIRKSHQAEIIDERAGSEVVTEGAHPAGTAATDGEDDDIYVEIDPANDLTSENQQNNEGYFVPNFSVVPPTTVLQHSPANAPDMLHLLTNTKTEESMYVDIDNIGPVARYSPNGPTNPSLTGISARRKKTRPSLDLVKQKNTKSS